jgi:hypothetical protein
LRVGLPIRLLFHQLRPELRKFEAERVIFASVAIEGIVASHVIVAVELTVVVVDGDDAIPTRVYVPQRVAEHVGVAVPGLGVGGVGHDGVGGGDGGYCLSLVPRTLNEVADWARDGWRGSGRLEVSLQSAYTARAMAIRECLIDLDGQKSGVTIEHRYFGSARWVRVRGGDVPGSDQLFVGRDGFRFDLLGHRASVRYWVEGVWLVHELRVGDGVYSILPPLAAGNDIPMNEYEAELLDDVIGQLAVGAAFDEIARGYRALGIDSEAAEEYLRPFLPEATSTAKTYSISTRRMLLIGLGGAFVAIAGGLIVGFVIAYAVEGPRGAKAGIFAVLVGPMAIGRAMRAIAYGFRGSPLQLWAGLFTLVSGGVGLVSGRLLLGHPFDGQRWYVGIFTILYGLVWVWFFTRRKKFRPL